MNGNETEIKILDDATERRAKLAEVCSLRNLPEAGFQSYEMLANDALKQRDSFLASESRNPEIHYKKLADLSGMDKGILALARGLEAVDRLTDDPEVMGAMRTSLGYRQAEMEFIKLLGQLDYVVNELQDADEARELAEEAKAASEALYGKADPELTDRTLNTVWSRLDGREFSGKAALLYNDLVNGFTSSEGFQIGAMKRAENTEMFLPDMGEAAFWAGEYFQESNADIQALLQEFWDEKVEEWGENYECGPLDIAEAFRRVVDLRDPEGLAGIDVIVSDGTALSWESPLVAIKIGRDRPPIKTSETLFTRTNHEFGVHGQSAINGAKTDIPALATGLYTDTPEPDYLTFEEGFAVVMEDAISSAKKDWSGGRVNYYLGVSFAEDGDDFRSVFEKTWRYNLLQQLKDGEEVTEEMIQKHRRMAYGSCVRIFRGTQTNLREKLGVDVSFTYNKDLSYLAGSVKALKYIEQAYEKRDEGMLDVVLLGKYDPTNPVQNDIATKAFNRAGLLAA